MLAIIIPIKPIKRNPPSLVRSFLVVYPYKLIAPNVPAVIKNTLVQTGDLEFGKKENIDYGKIGTGKSGLGTINSEVDAPFDFEKGSVALARTQKYNTEDSQFFILLKNEPLYETEFTPIGKVIYGLKALEKIKYLDKSQYVLRPDFINSLRMLIN